MSPIQILSPEGAVKPPQDRTVTAIPDLAGRRIAVLDNGKPNARLLLTSIADRLAAAANADVALVTAKATAATPAEPEILQQLAAAEVVVTGSAD